LAFPGADVAARKLQQLMSEHLDHDAVRVRPYGQYLVMDMTGDGDPYPVARLTRLEPGQYGLSFRLHTGRWDPQPVAGSLEEVAKLAAQMLGPYFDPSNL
jgi:hypothetical protein